jgi:hypothetical protein
MPIHLLLLVAALGQSSLSTGGADSTPANPTVDDLLARIAEADRARVAALHDYTSLRSYSLENKRFGTKAAMTVRLTYHHPGQKQFEVLQESGSSFIRKRVLKRMIASELEASSDGMREATQITPRNYSFRLLGTDMLEGRRSFVLEAEPKTVNKFLFRGKVWVDAEDFAVARVEGAPAQNPSFWIRKTGFVHRYAKFGPFWLAVTNASDTDVRIFGETIVKIQYSDYDINRGSRQGE